MKNTAVFSLVFVLALASFPAPRAYAEERYSETFHRAQSIAQGAQYAACGASAILLPSFFGRKAKQIVSRTRAIAMAVGLPLCAGTFGAEAKLNSIANRETIDRLVATYGPQAEDLYLDILGGRNIEEAAAEYLDETARESFVVGYSMFEYTVDRLVAIYGPQAKDLFMDILNGRDGEEAATEYLDEPMRSQFLTQFRQIEENLARSRESDPLGQ